MLGVTGLMGTAARWGGQAAWIAGFLILAAAACNGGDGGGDGGAPGESTPTATTLPPAPRAEGTLDEAVVLGDTSVLLANLQDPFPLEDPSVPISADERLIAFDVEIENVGESGELNYAAVFFTAIDGEAEKIYVPSAGEETTLTAGRLQAGQTASGRIVFVLPATANIDTVRYKPFEERDLILISLPE